MRLPNGFGSVHKLPGNRRKPYRARITVGFKCTSDNIKTQEYRTLGYYATKEEGIVALVKFNQRPYDLNYKDITFAQIYEEWSDEHYKKIVSSSKRIWMAAYNHSKPLHALKFKDIRVANLEKTISDASVGEAIICYIGTLLKMKLLIKIMLYIVKHFRVLKRSTESLFQKMKLRCYGIM